MLSELKHVQEIFKEFKAMLDFYASPFLVFSYKIMDLSPRQTILD